eukprot:c55753_g1_i1 orf=89-286(-)
MFISVALGRDIIMSIHVHFKENNIISPTNRNNFSTQSQHLIPIFASKHVETIEAFLIAIFLYGIP